MFTTFLEYISDGCQILVIAVAIYYMWVFLRGTRAMQSLVGLGAVVVSMGAAAVFLKMDEIGWLLSLLLPSLPIALIVVFHPEIRRVLAGIGERAASIQAATDVTVREVVESVGHLAKQRIGALIAFERTVSLRQYQQNGTVLNAPVVADLLNSVFCLNAPMHDGGVIIRNSLIAAAGCVFPLATGETERRSYGTRHRAAIGLSEESDAVVIVVSEETGLISIAYRGELTRGVELDGVREVLEKTMAMPARSRKLGGARSPANADLPHDAEALSKTDDQVAAAIAAAKDAGGEMP